MFSSILSGRKSVVYAKKNSKEINIVVRKANTKTVKKLDSSLKKEVGINLYFSGGKNHAKSSLKKLQTKIKRVNKQGVLFHAHYQGKAKYKGKKYDYYYIFPDEAGRYKYAVLFINKLFKHFKKNTNLISIDFGYYDKDYPCSNKMEYFHTAYKIYKASSSKKSFTQYIKDTRQTFISNTRELQEYAQKHGIHYEDDYIYHNKKVISIGTMHETRVNEKGEEEELVYLMKDEYEDEYMPIIRQLNAKIEEMKPFVDANYPLCPTEYQLFWHIVFDEAYSEKERVLYLLKPPLWGTTNDISDIAKSYEIAFKAKHFCDLSDAMKVWVINETGFFNCYLGSRNEYPSEKYDAKSKEWVEVTRKNLFCMLYDFSARTMPMPEPAERLKAMYKNKAFGVCGDFASYEETLFDQLGIDAYYAKNVKESLDDHAWSIIKAKNAKGKKLWIVFDYMILSDMGYVDGQVKREFKTLDKVYRAYFKGIKKRYGKVKTPKGINFKKSDFN